MVFLPSLRIAGSLLVRTRGPAETVIPLLRSVANAEAPRMPVTRATTLAMSEARQRSRVRRLMLGTAGGGLVALFLCAIGLYAAVSFAVGERTREIGVRTALGADPGRVVGHFFRPGLMLSLIGLAIGLVLSTVVMRLATLAAGSAFDARIILIAGVVASVVVAVGSLATWIPARRAAQIDPFSMLRLE